MWFVHGFVHGRPLKHAAHAAPVCSTDHERTADDQLGERVGDLAVGLQVGLDVLLHGERHVGVTDPLLSAFQSIFASRPAVA